MQNYQKDLKIEQIRKKKIEEVTLQFFEINVSIQTYLGRSYDENFLYQDSLSKAKEFDKKNFEKCQGDMEKYKIEMNEGAKTFKAQLDITKKTSIPEMVATMKASLSQLLNQKIQIQVLNQIVPPRLEQIIEFISKLNDQTPHNDIQRYFFCCFAPNKILNERKTRKDDKNHETKIHQETMVKNIVTKIRIGLQELQKPNELFTEATLFFN